MAVGDTHVFPGFPTPVLPQLSFQSHQLLFSHASAEVRGENTPERKLASTGYRIYNHVISPTRSPLSTAGSGGGGGERKRNGIVANYYHRSRERNLPSRLSNQRLRYTGSAMYLNECTCIQKSAIGKKEKKKKELDKLYMMTPAGLTSGQMHYMYLPKKFPYLLVFRRRTVLHQVG